MKRLVLLPMILALLQLSLPLPSLAADLVVDILPGAILANTKADGFSVTGPNGKEEVSLISSIPTVTAGIALPITEGYIDLKAGAGLLLNGALSSFMVCGLAGLYVEARPSMLLGPHFGIAHFTEPDWWGNNDVTLSSSTGFLVGVHLAAGDRIAYLLSVDYLSVAFDAQAAPETITMSDDRLDMSGIAIQFGIRAQF
jgi:hypothetical protein